MDLVHFYHLFAGGDWRDPLAEHLWSLHEAGFDCPFHVGVVGSPQQRAEALAELCAIRKPENVIEADRGWEQVTLFPLHEYAKTHDGAILYAHSKGAGNPGRFQEVWRRGMLDKLVTDWREALEALSEVDVVGSFWRIPERGDSWTPHFGGNFWMARSDYLAKLNPPRIKQRHDAEMWIGTGKPTVRDLNPDANWGERPGHRLVSTPQPHQVVF